MSVNITLYLYFVKKKEIVNCKQRETERESKTKIVRILLIKEIKYVAIPSTPKYAGLHVTMGSGSNIN